MLQAPDIEQVEARIAIDPAAEGFGALAEAYRRAGRLSEARQVATAGLALRPDDSTALLALGLILWDAGEVAEARSALERLTETLPGAAIGSGEPGPELDPVPLAEEELDAALAAVRPMLEEESEPVRAADPGIRHSSSGGAEGSAIEGGPTFATETMARLYDAQGDSRAADAIRRRLGLEAPDTDDTDGAAAVAPDPPSEPDPVVEALEAWLRNQQGSRP